MTDSKEEKPFPFPPCRHRKRVGGMEMCYAIGCETVGDMLCECYGCERENCPKRAKTKAGK